MPLLAAGYHVLVPDTRGYGDSDKRPGTEGYDGRSLYEEFRALAQLHEECPEAILEHIKLLTGLPQFA